MKAGTLLPNSLAVVQMAAARPITNSDVVAIVGCGITSAGGRLTYLTNLGWLERAGVNEEGKRIWRATKRGAEYACGNPAPVIVRNQSKPKIDPKADPIYTDKTKRTIAPAWTHDPRYQLPPGTKVEGAFSSLKPGQYLE